MRRLGAGDIRVFLCNWDTHLGCLDTPRLLDRRGQVRRRVRSDAGHDLAAYMVAESMKVSRQTVRISAPRDFAPKVDRLKELDDLSVSWSYSGSTMAVAVSATKFIGVDIASTESRRGLDVFFDIHGTVAERRWLTRQADHSVGAAMLWSAKEALAKANGRGLAAGWEELQLVPISRGGFVPARADPEIPVTIGAINSEGLALSAAFPGDAKAPQLLDWRYKRPCVCTAIRTGR